MRRFLLFSCLLSASPALAHIPYIEHRDYSAGKPFMVTDSIENSKAIYSWFKDGQDVDVIQFDVVEPVRLLTNSLVPVCPGYEELLPAFAVVGPGLPFPEETLPFDLPDGYGAIVVDNVEPGAEREVIYEPVGGKSYYNGPIFDQDISEPGTWYLYSWDPYEMGGDYVAVTGFEEGLFQTGDLMRSIVNTAVVRQDGELHVDCPQ